MATSDLTRHFTLAEFTRSAVATARGIDNTLPENLMPNAVATCEMLERIRYTLDAPILISSGYRSPALNLAIGSSSTSDHPRAQAADWTAPAFGTPTEICRKLAPLVSVLGIGQLILEYPGRGNGAVWVHTSTRLPPQIVNRVISIGPNGAMLGVQERFA